MKMLLCCKFSNSCSHWLSVMGLVASGWSFDLGESIGVASVYEEGEGEVSFGCWKAIGWKDDCEKLVGLGSDSRVSSRVSISGLVWVESSETMRGELEKNWVGEKR